MPEMTHQVVRLSKGRHTSPDHGVCVMELASMLAGERFTDRPRTVCPVIAAFLRTYNDGLDDERRQDLYRYASEAVGTVAARDVERERAERCAAWARELAPASRFVLRRWALRTRLRMAGQFAAHVATRSLDDGRHRRALAFVDELIAIGRAPSPAEERPEAVLPVAGDRG
jgi:hypothetical protein